MENKNIIPELRGEEDKYKILDNNREEDEKSEDIDIRISDRVTISIKVDKINICINK